MESNRIKSSFFTERLQPTKLSLWEWNATNCDASIVWAIQWAFHFQVAIQTKVSLYKLPRREAAACIKITIILFCHVRSSRVKSLSWPDIVSIILALCKTAVQMSPEMMMWNISNTKFYFYVKLFKHAVTWTTWTKSNHSGQFLLQCALDNKVLFCESVQYIKVGIHSDSV